MGKSVIGLVGRPNVGKSTLFNRIVGQRRAIIEDMPGTTRDRLYADTQWAGHDITIVDMGGLEGQASTGIRRKVRQQIEAAIDEADVILFIVDAQDRLLADDWEVADVLRRTSKKVLLVANKVDRGQHHSNIFQFYELGMGDPIPISAYHGKGIDELLDEATRLLPDTPDYVVDSASMKIAIVGRPNAGKSMLLNCILGEDRAVVDEVPGTTRDALDTILHCDGETIVFIDTAGIRRRGKIQQGVERHSLIRSMQAIERADVAVLVIDATEGIAAQDAHILGSIKEAYKGGLIAVNKWDLVNDENQQEWIHEIRERTKFMPHVPTIFISAITGYGVADILPTARVIYAERIKQVCGTRLNSLIKEAAIAHPHAKGGKRLGIKKAMQTGINPPTFTIIVNDAKLVHFSYKRYLENQIRRNFGFEGTAIRVLFKSKGEEAVFEV
ncbi:MAG: ribosome biogenesis GTPase Der [Chloroflexota bacterium]|nr:ribosome biogenesis GTPase Der [Chloroflexota bacterium]